MFGLERLRRQSILCLGHQQIKHVSDKTQTQPGFIKSQSDLVCTSRNQLFCLTRLHVVSLSGFSLSLRGLFSFVPSIKHLCRALSPSASLSFKLTSLCCDESVFHYLPRHPRRFLQHIEARYLHRCNRGGCTRCQQRRAERGRRLIYSFFIEEFLSVFLSFLSIHSCLFVESPKEQEKKRVCTT